MLIDVPAVCAILGIGRAKLFQMFNDGTFGPERVRLGGCLRFREDEVRAWVGQGCPARGSWHWEPTTATA